MSYSSTKKRRKARRNKSYIKRLSSDKIRIKTLQANKSRRRKRRRSRRRRKRRKLRHRCKKYCQKHQQHHSKRKGEPQIVVYHPLAYRPNVMLMMPKKDDVFNELSINDILELYPQLN